MNLFKVAANELILLSFMQFVGNTGLGKKSKIDRYEVCNIIIY
jgi:hypothetical protein